MQQNRFLSAPATFLLALLIALTAAAPRSEAASKYKILHAFAGKPDGGGVFAGLALDPKGNLYGGTTGGGAYGYGTVFELTPGPSGKWTQTILHSFCKDFPHCSDGTLLWDTPVLDSKGDLFDDSNAGIFEMIPEQHGWSFKLIYSGSEGERDLAPYNAPGIDDLLLDAAGNLYGPFGTGENYNGAIGELSPGTDGWKEEDIFDFCLPLHNSRCLGGSLPEFRLAWDESGNLYGVTTEGGKYGCGAVFQLEYSGSAWQERVLHSFCASQSDGYAPYAGPVVDQAGNVYGTTLQGGRNASGTVFELSPLQDGRWKETILYDFPNGASNGEGPAAGLTFDKAGNLYGTSTAGGDPSCSCGVVFKMTPGSNGKWTYTVLHRFTGKDGWVPQASVILDDRGNIYGTTTEGGPGGYGVVYEITP